LSIPPLHISAVFSHCYAYQDQAPKGPDDADDDEDSVASELSERGHDAAGTPLDASSVVQEVAFHHLHYLAYISV
jgi:hypothetical protein